MFVLLRLTHTEVEVTVTSVSVEAGLVHVAVMTV